MVYEYNPGQMGTSERPAKAANESRDGVLHAAGVTPNQGLENTEAEQAAAAAQNAAAAELRREAEERQREAEKAARERQAEIDEAGVVDPDEPPTQLGDGGVSVQYLGTSDEFDFGPASDDDDRHVVARAGGDPVSIPQDLFDRVKVLPYDQFVEVKS